MAVFIVLRRIKKHGRRKKKKTYRIFTRSEKAIVHAYVELMQKNKKITVTDIVNTVRSLTEVHFTHISKQLTMFAKNPDGRYK